MPTDTTEQRPARDGLLTTLADISGFLLLASPFFVIGILYILVS